MKNRILGLAVVLVACLAVHTIRAADEKAADTAGKCPVSGKDASKAHAVSFEGGKVYFCCDECPAAFEKEPAKFAAKAHHQMALTGQLVEVKCPLTGKPLNAEQTVDVDGVKVAFCCANCKKAVAALKGDEQIDKVFKDVSKGYKLAEAKDSK